MENPIDAAPQSVDELKEWETPELVIEDIAAVTRGGNIGDFEADDEFYS